MKKLKIGVLALQGAVSEHIEALEKVMNKLYLKGKVITVKKPEDLNDIAGLVIPGGESTTIDRLMVKTGIWERIIMLAKKGLPILGTCAGAILLAKKGDKQVEQTRTILLNLMEMKVLRNAYGRQLNSFETDVKIPEIGNKLFRAVFIRAPVIEKVWGKTKVWAKYKNKIIGAKKGNVLALTFHPELTNDLRIHEYFVKTILP
ncbi:MAG: pyridoxal 5'-phosphate synthase glutaminase subunit PdxT [Candidatus Nealsonbacteria bacterium CG_4_9_14_0_2_um_filter_37_38]|uniref:Pyridoxal 5'-phosphate synthase subunit PdxT n=1 Tax=Candidatus Nealsonbacteria bacterium CG_4_10_14_0_8_um_filter_37_14 TaxID=1974684 RepID=A0A2M7R6P2_9BACT|nr:MAG: pyridoxal 5'-phosphate synthase glutaminase subunit PdxT [Candidatus Nealsonbacteria bacterium CG11_big_fil_rev_8_21_14_0_20_37_68]PIW92355.1 MAG: pyridoxal 5'-phosphate synthase glutaminase subunit PdxT [Candidatus Nealsonbacteria bacterium CG_4_8_14_3_um_filter_37_23]PIY89303.1 MAG: pyridoxal 5'-phosphate synthase glutaminase subunit PdxT [Candidatus Nealsonbacteria bacterium CG_4_10_14_0_8_um_filter_37_14]PJC51734.1 MAG: pyridoxal 5'-phosphate synthase glutaminase subunit PdxT [Candid